MCGGGGLWSTSGLPEPLTCGGSMAGPRRQRGGSSGCAGCSVLSLADCFTVARCWTPAISRSAPRTAELEKPLCDQRVLVSEQCHVDLARARAMSCPLPRHVEALREGCSGRSSRWPGLQLRHSLLGYLRGAAAQGCGPPPRRHTPHWGTGGDVAAGRAGWLCPSWAQLCSRSSPSHTAVLSTCLLN